MHFRLYETPLHAYRDLVREIHTDPASNRGRWQGIDTARRPEAKTFEMVNVTIGFDLGGIEDVRYWDDCCRPFQPWADQHFDERVGGAPLNPGNTWHKWRHGKSADRFRNTSGQFNHTYMERFWPRFAGDSRPDPHVGIRNEYGDLSSVVRLLASDPFTRQAYLPIFFPEDTGIGDGGRKPCTLGYHFMRSGDRINLYYPMRSCDLVNHFLDDCYLAIRLVLWVLDQCREWDPEWNNVKPGEFVIHATSLHAFVNDHRTALENIG